MILGRKRVDFLLNPKMRKLIDQELSSNDNSAIFKDSRCVRHNHMLRDGEGIQEHRNIQNASEGEGTCT